MERDETVKQSKLFNQVEQEKNNEKILDLTPSLDGIDSNKYLQLLNASDEKFNEEIIKICDEQIRAIQEFKNKIIGG